MRYFLLCLALLIPTAASADTLKAEAQYKPEGNVALIRIYITNTSQQQQTLFTGIRGGSRSGAFSTIDADRYIQLHRRADKGEKVTLPGQGKILPPTFVFSWGTFTAPQVTVDGKTFRSMVPTLLRLEPGERTEYYKCRVPISWLSGEFSHGNIPFPKSDFNDETNVRIERFDETD